MMGRKINIFVIYTLADKDKMHHLLRHSDPLKKGFNASIWHDDPIIPGQPWKTYFESRLHHTDIFLLLVSEDFMNSQFIKQKEFKAVIDRHKKNQSVVIPIIMDNCQWDIDHKFTDYEFNLRELQVLPEKEKPLSEWDSSEQVYQNVVQGTSKIITPFVAHLNQEEVKKIQEKKTTNEPGNEQVAISFTEKVETDKTAEEPIKPEEKIDIVEENRLWEEAEIKRRAEVAERIREEAEASAKRRAEEDRLWEEAMARRRAEKAQRIVEDAELVADRRAEEKQSTDEGEETKTNPSEKSRPKEIAKAEATLAAEQKKRKAKEEARRKAKEAKKIKLDAEAHTEVETKAAGEDPSIKKRALKIGIGAFIAVAIIWAFTIFNTSTEEPLPAVPKNKAATVEESNELEKPNLDSLNKVAAFAKLAVGDHYDGGIIFAIDHANKTGKIAHLEDAGPMPWYNAVKIDEQLGEGWRLPSFDELTAMYKALGPGATNIGEFTNELYWSSTAYDENQARLLRFWDGNTSYHYNKNVEHRKFKVRAIRDFRL